MNVSILVIDIFLTFVDGRRIIRAFRSDSRMKIIPILAISADHGQEMVSSCMSAGADAFNPKPTPLKAFINTIEALVPRPS